VEHVSYFLDLKSESRVLFLGEAEERKVNFVKISELLKSKDTFAYQRSRLRWLKEGDTNTSFFHA